jgi:hypothetical protein
MTIPSLRLNQKQYLLRIRDREDFLRFSIQPWGGLRPPPFGGISQSERMFSFVVQPLPENIHNDMIIIPHHELSSSAKKDSSLNTPRLRGKAAA